MIIDREPFSGQFSLEDVQNLEDSNQAKPKTASKTVNKAALKQAVAVQKNGVTITGLPADQVVIDPIIEETGKHGVLAFGRMNPPTVGHEQVVNKVHQVAKQHNAVHKIVLSHSQDAKKNPLPVEKKVKHARNAFPGTNIEGASKEHPTIMHHAAQMHAAGVEHLHVVGGSDRADEYKKLLHKYNGVAGKHGHYNFKSITVHSSGERDPDSEGTEGVSGTKMREHAASGNKEAFHKGLPSKMKKAHKEALWKDVQHHMAHPIKEEIECELLETASIQLRLHRAAMMKRYSARIERARDIARKRLAKSLNLRRRALKKARSTVRTRIAGQRGANYANLSTSDKIAIDRLADKRKKQIYKIADRIAPRIKRDEIQRLAAVAAGKQVRNSKMPIVASYEMDMNNTLTEKAANALIRKAEKANVSLSQIAEVYTAGLASYPADSKQTPQQWAFASVNTFLANVSEWTVKHDGVDQDHPDQDVRRLFAGKKNVVNHLTKYKDSAEKRAKVLKDKGFKNVRIEEESLDEVSFHTLDKAWHGRYQQALAAKNGSPEHQKAHKSMGKIGDVMKKRIDKKLTHMAKHDPEAYKKSAQQVADDNTKRGWSNESRDACPVCGQTPCNCTHISERKDVLYTARNMANVDFDKLPKVHTFAQHQKIKADVEGETDKNKANRKKADLIRRAAGEIQRKIVEQKDTGSVYVRTANKLVRSQSPQIADTKKRMVAALKNKDYNGFTSIILYLLKDQLKGDKRIKQE